MSFFGGFSFIHCPECGEAVFASSVTLPGESEHYATVCENCKTTVEISRDPATDRMEVRKAKRH